MQNNNDRIIDTYYGTVGNKKTIEHARSRVHWICNSTSGLKVLDIGCSQGLVSILLAREGFDVTGIDIREDAIKFANDQKQEENDATKKKLSFKICNGINFKVDEGQKFDTVIIGEILEHQSHPQRLLNNINKNLLKEEGRIIITTPFGLFPDPDHKYKFYISNFLNEIEELFEVDEIIIENKYLYCIAHKTGKKAKISFYKKKGITNILELIESAFSRIEDEYRYELDEIYRKLNSLYVDHKNVLLENKNQSAQIDELEKINQNLQKIKNEIKNFLHNDLQVLHDKISKSSFSEDLLNLINNQKKENIEDVFSGILKMLFLIATSEIQDKERLQKDLKDSHASFNDDILKIKAISENLENEVGHVKRERDALILENKNLKNLISKLQSDTNRLNEQLQKQIKQNSNSVDQKYMKSKEIQIKKLSAELTKLKGEVRYKLGDALVGSMYNPKLLPKLPFTVSTLFSEGLKKNLERRKNEKIEKNKSLKVMTAYSEADKRKQTNIEDISCSPQALEKEEEVNVRFSLDILGIDKVEKLKDLKLVSVLDEFSEQSFEHECQLIKPRPDNWKSMIEYYRPQALLVESAWKGNSGSWQYRVAKYSHPPGNELYQMVDYCNKKEIPTIFWNKEDPVHFDLFIASARNFKTILTSDERLLDNYKKETQANNVDSLMFAAQPLIHNPVNLKERNGKICFSGSYYANRFEARKQEMNMLLDAASKFDFDIFDRNYGKTGPDSEHFRFPERFAKHIKGELPYNQVVNTYKKYRVYLNVNSVVDSPTMFSRRVFELLACGTPIVSTYSKGIENIFGKNIVWMVKNEDEVKHALETLLTDEYEWKKRQLLGLRKVFQNHTYRDRIIKILNNANIHMEDEKPKECLLVASVNSKTEIKKMVELFQSQTYSNKNLLLISSKKIQHNRSIPINKNVSIVEKKLVNNGYLHELLKNKNIYLLGLLNSENVYFPYYLEDLVLSEKYSNASVLTKPIDSREYTYGVSVDPFASVLKVYDAINKNIDLIEYINSPKKIDMHAKGLNTYSIDSFNYKSSNESQTNKRSTLKQKHLIEV